MPAYVRFAALAFITSFVGPLATIAAEIRVPCAEDAMIVFDASGSMSSGDWGYTHENAVASRIDLVRDSLRKILASVTRYRRVGLMTYGPTAVPGLFNQCDNITLNLRPAPSAAASIIASVQSLVPVGGTPLTRAVEQSAEVLDFRRKPGVLVVLTDGWDTCGGSPCRAGKALHATAAQLTIHVIVLKAKALSRSDEDRFAGTRCLAEQNGGLYIAPETPEELIAALETTLGCPKLSQGPLMAPSRRKSCCLSASAFDPEWACPHGKL